MATSKRRESQVEERICKRAKQHGGTAYKFTSPGRRSVPDRLIVTPCWRWLSTVPFIEAKAPGKTATDPQKREHAKLRRAGALTLVLDDYDMVDFVFDVMCDGSCETKGDNYSE